MLKALTLLLLAVPLSAQPPQTKAGAPKADTTKPAELKVAAAADLQPVLEVLAPIYERRMHVHLTVSYASSSVLATQIINGAPFDLFLGADYYFPEKVVAANLADTGSPIPYARGTLVLWARKDSGFNPLHLNALESPKVKTIAIANPDRAPYGRAADAALRKMGWYARLQPLLVQAENVSQAGQFAMTGNAQLALISQTLAMSPKFKEAGNFVLFPQAAYAEIRQCAVVMRNSSSRDTAHAFLKWMLGSEVQGNLPKLGLRSFD